MMRKYLWLGLPLAVFGLAAGRSFGPAKDIPAGTGYSALELCTRTMQSGESLEHVRTRYLEPTVQPLPAIWAIDYQPGESVSVSTVLPTLTHPRTAIFRKGLGCTVVAPGTTEAGLRAQAFAPAPELAPDARPWPLGEATAQPELLSAKARAAIDKHAELIFGEQPPLNATALLVARDGQLLYERYGQGYTREQPQLGWSMTKTLTALIAGVLARDGKLALDAQVGLPQWAGTPKQEITWRQLLNMAPGLEWFEGYGGASDATQMLFSQSDEGMWAADRRLTSKPGTVFTYSTGFTNIAMRRMRQLVGGSHQALYELYQRELFAPLGIRRAVIEPDASGTPVGGARGLLRPVDWLRLGQLVANGGAWQGTTVLTPEYATFLTSASPASAGYGGSIWREPSEMFSPEQRTRLPDDLVMFAGFLGQYTVVVPSAQLIVLRMGVAVGGSIEHDPARDQMVALVAELLE